MKKLLLSLLATIMVVAAVPASATVVSTLHQTFASGATFTGQVTFTDNYNSLLDVDGTLSGGPYGTMHFGWTWWAGTGGTHGNYDANPATYEDWLMNGNVAGSYTHFIGLSWFHGAQSLSLVLSPDTDVYYAGINSSDATLSATTGNVPEPGSLALLGLGVLAIGMVRRRRP